MDFGPEAEFILGPLFVMRISSFILYVTVGMIGILPTAIIADQHPQNLGLIYASGLTVTLLLFPVTFLARRNLDRLRYGTKVTVDLKRYKVPILCPETGRDATEARVAQFTMTGGVADLHGGFPVMLSLEGAAAFDKRLLKSVAGLRVVRAAYRKITLYVKDERYLRAMRDANRDSGAMSA
jgi:hypothetical protein